MSEDDKNKHLSAIANRIPDSVPAPAPAESRTKPAPGPEDTQGESAATPAPQTVTATAVRGTHYHWVAYGVIGLALLSTWLMTYQLGRDNNELRQALTRLDRPATIDPAHQHPRDPALESGAREREQLRLQLDELSDAVATMEDELARLEQQRQAAEAVQEIPDNTGDNGTAGATKTIAEPPETAAELKPAAAEATPVSGWYVNLRSFETLSAAETWQQGLEESPAAFDIVRVERDGKTYYRVRVGPWSDRDEAREQHARLKQQWEINGSWLSR